MCFSVFDISMELFPPERMNYHDETCLCIAGRSRLSAKRKAASLSAQEEVSYVCNAALYIAQLLSVDLQH